MKKTLLVAAMMASFTGAAVAQNSVTLYGRLAPSVDYTSIKLNDKAATTVGLAKGAGTFNQFQMSDAFNASGAGSIWGLRGVEDLGNGLKVSFQFEQELSSTNGAATSASGRVAAVTVSNAAWGSIGFGRDVGAADAIMGGIRALTGIGGNGNVALETATQRYSNQVKYLSPTISGFRVGLSYSFAGTAIKAPVTPFGAIPTGFGTSTQNRVLNAGLRYANGPLVAAALYTQANPANNVGGKAISNYLIGGTYDLKVVKIHAAFGQSKDGFFSRTANPILTGNFAVGGTGAIALPGAKSDQYALGLTAPVGPGSVAFSFAQKKPKGTVNVAAAGTQTTTGIAYTYNLSKRTSISAGYSYNKNIGFVDGITMNQIGGGIVHSF